VYLEEGLSPARTGRRLSIHLNTVVYRVKQAESILGRPIEERRLELEAALRLAERLAALEESAMRGQVHGGGYRSTPRTA
jgi:DNA-binding PucR family transcriptional regulator